MPEGVEERTWPSTKDSETKALPEKSQVMMILWEFKERRLEGRESLRERVIGD